MTFLIGYALLAVIVFGLILGAIKLVSIIAASQRYRCHRQALRG